MYEKNIKLDIIHGKIPRKIRELSGNIEAIGSSTAKGPTAHRDYTRDWPVI